MTFATPHARRRRRTLAAFMAFIWLTLPSALWAYDCQALDINNLPRDCTWLEKHGQCLVNAADSRDQCLERAEGIFQWYRCHEDAAIDFTACALQIPFRIIFT